MKWAWIENARIRDICHGDPNECYHPDVAKFYQTQVPDHANNGDWWLNDVVVTPAEYTAQQEQVIDVVATEIIDAPAIEAPADPVVEAPPAQE